MKRTYFCPHCEGNLNPNVKIVLRAAVGGQTGLFLFSPQPGNYDVIIPEGFRLKKKDIVAFSCPICNADLTSPRDKDLASIRFASTFGAEGTVAFAREYGRHATYFITRESVRAYGEHASAEKINFWGVGPRR